MGLFKKDKKVVESVIKTDKGEGPSFFKGYDIKWLKETGEEHGDFGLVEVYEKKYGVIEL